MRGDDDETLTVRSTRHGPLLDPLLGDERAPLAISWAGSRVSASGGLPAWLAVARSRSDERAAGGARARRRARGRGGLCRCRRRGGHAGGGLDPAARALDRSGAPAGARALVRLAGAGGLRAAPARAPRRRARLGDRGRQRLRRGRGRGGGGVAVALGGARAAHRCAAARGDAPPVRSSCGRWSSCRGTWTSRARAAWSRARWCSRSAASGSRRRRTS